MKIRFLEKAQFELDEAISYYNLEFQGLGDRFLQEVLNAIKSMGSDSIDLSLLLHVVMPDLFRHPVKQL